MSSRATILNALKDSAARFREEVALPCVDTAALFRDLHADQAAAVELFQKKLTALRGEVFVEATKAAAAQRLTLLLSGIALSRCVASDEPIVQAVLSNEISLEGVLQASQWEPLSSAEQSLYEVGITGCDALISRCGSVALRTASHGGRRLSILPPFHIVLARADQLVPSLHPWLSVVSDETRGSSLTTIITGPSRTADIEKILVLGAHGPKRLAVIVVNGDCVEKHLT